MIDEGPIRNTCDFCGDLYFPTSESEDCPHEKTSSFTKAMAAEVQRRLREMLHGDE